MPSCVQLTKIGESEPAQFADIDEEMRTHFGVPQDPKRWYLNWYNWLALGLAAGLSFDEIKAAMGPSKKDEDLVDYVAKNYTVKTWYESKY